VIRSALLSSFAGFGHAHSTRDDGPVGPLRLPGAAEARAALVRAAGGDPASLAVPEQVHGARVAFIERGGQTIAATDGLVTATPGVTLFAQGADCPLVALYDPESRVAAVVHSGWRGSVARICAEAVSVMHEAGAGSRIVAAIFPGIGPCCFEVGLEVETAFRDAFGGPSRAWFSDGASDDKRMLDVRAAIVQTLAETGVRRERIETVPGCTACGGTLYSHRASRGGPERHGLCVLLT
jgi:YfiH family protein